MHIENSSHNLIIPVMHTFTLHAIISLTSLFNRILQMQHHHSHIPPNCSYYKYPDKTYKKNYKQKTNRMSRCKQDLINPEEYGFPESRSILTPLIDVDFQTTEAFANNSCPHLSFLTRKKLMAEYENTKLDSFYSEVG